MQGLNRQEATIEDDDIKRIRPYPISDHDKS